MSTVAAPSIFDTPTFNERLFYPMPDEVPPPPGAEDILVEVPGGTVQLRVYPGDGVPLLAFPGNGERPSDYDRMVGHYAAIGGRLAVAGYRSYGKGTGVPTLRGAQEDAVAAFEAYAGAVEGPIVVLGRSLGSCCVAELGARAHALPRLAGIVWECGLVDLFGLIARRGLPVPESLPEADMEAFSPARKLARCPLPFLAVHGTEDDCIPAPEARLAYEASAGAQRELLLIEGAGHCGVLAHQAYWDAVERFLKSV